MPNSVLAFGVFSPTGALVGAVVYGELGSPQGVVGFRQRHDLPEGRLLELTRLWLSDDCGKNSESRVIQISLRLLHRALPNVVAVVAYADPSVGHMGGIYRAAGFEYAGLGPQRYDWVPTEYAEAFIQTRKLPAEMKTKHGLARLGIPAKKVERVSKQRWLWRFR